MCRKTHFFHEKSRPREAQRDLRYPALLRTIRVLFFAIRPHFVRYRALFDLIKGKQLGHLVEKRVPVEDT